MPMTTLSRIQAGDGQHERRRGRVRRCRSARLDGLVHASRVRAAAPAAGRLSRSVVRAAQVREAPRRRGRGAVVQRARGRGGSGGSSARRVAGGAVSRRCDEHEPRGRRRRGVRHARAWSLPTARASMARRSEIVGDAALRPPVERRVAASQRAGRIGAAASRRRTRQRAPANARFATVAKPCSSARSASSRWAMRSPAGSVGVVDAHAAAVHAPAAAAATSSAPASPTSHDAERARARARGRCARAARARRGRRGRRAARAPRARPPRGAARPRAHDVGAALGVELGDDPGVREAGERDGRAPAAGARSSSDAGGEERHDVRDRRQRPQRARARRRRSSSTRGRQWTRGRARGASGSAATAAQPPLIGRRMITRSASTGSSRPARRGPRRSRPSPK